MHAPVCFLWAKFTMNTIIFCGTHLLSTHPPHTLSAPLVFQADLRCPNPTNEYRFSYFLAIPWDFHANRFPYSSQVAAHHMFELSAVNTATVNLIITSYNLKIKFNLLCLFLSWTLPTGTWLILYNIDLLTNSSCQVSLDTHSNWLLKTCLLCRLKVTAFLLKAQKINQFFQV